MMKQSHTTTTGPNSLCIAATSSSGVNKPSTLCTGKPSNIKGKAQHHLLNTLTQVCIQMAANWGNTPPCQQHSHTKLPFLQLPHRNPPHIFRCPNPQQQQITIECISQLQTSNTKWKVPEQLTTSILEHLTSWVTNEPSPPWDR
jgi:hypothetical protein